MFLDPKYSNVFGPEFIKAVAAQKPAVYPDELVGLDRVIAGEHDFIYWVWDQVAYLKWKQGAPIRWIHPDPTPGLNASMYGISKYAPHPYAAGLFLNWIMSEDGALSLQRIGFNTALGGFKDTRKFASESWYDPIKKRYDVDWDRWSKNYHTDMDLWVKTMMGGK